MVDGSIPRLVVVGSLRRQTEQAIKRKSEISILHGLSISSPSYLQDSALCEFLPDLLR